MSLDAGHIPRAEELLTVDYTTVDGLHITASTPFVSGVNYTSETNIAKMAMEGLVVESGALYAFAGQGIYQHGGTDSEHNLIIRKDTPVTGDVVGVIRIPRVASTSNGYQFSWFVLWPCTADDADADFYFSGKKTGGTNGLSLFNSLTDGTCLFSTFMRVGLNSNYRSVA